MTTEGEPSPNPGKGHPGLRWEGDGSLSKPAPRPQDDPTSPMHAPPPFPATATEGAPRPRFETDRPYASPWRRVGSYLIDVLVKLVIAEIVFFVGGMPVAIDPLDPAVFLPMEMIRRGYDLIFWSQGWTIGDRVLGMRIVDAQGNPPGFGRAIRRVFGAMLSELAFFVGHAWMIWDRRRQTWHDKIAGTYVVRVEEPRR